ncbi:metal tolerance protein A2-like [Trifolium pratense]|uniref:Metal tolerance protein A2-like n=3 Tax=Trifolium pratense TaxID=57577 RepID=A0A2K3NTQ8_TRIPR|nr:metal tolerance protein A2-like [Trifolium pratense]
MGAQSIQHTQIIEISGELPDTGRKICGEATCEFSDAGSISKDSEERLTSMRKLLIAVSLCVIFMAVEVVGGIKANSLAILTDAAHLLSDVAAFAISLFSIWAGGWEPNPRQSFGFFRIEILGALVSMQLIWLLAGILVYEAISRLIAGPQNVDGFLMFVVAAFGLVVNIIMALVLGHDHGHGHGHDHGHDHHGRSHGISVSTNRYVKHTNDEHHHTDGDHTRHHDDEVHHHDHDHKEVTEPLLGESKARPEKTKKRNINVHGAYLHVLGDSIQSIGVMIGGAIIWPEKTKKRNINVHGAYLHVLGDLIVLFTTINMLRNILEVLMESTPREIDSTRLQKGLLEMDEVVAVHELHIWAITVGKVLLACHVKINPEADADMMLDKIIDYIKIVHSISHVTIQIER